MVEFVSYDGAYPNLCSGQLVLKINGQVREFSRHCLQSGGTVWFDNDWDAQRTDAGLSTSRKIWNRSERKSRNVSMRIFLTVVVEGAYETDCVRC